MKRPVRCPKCRRTDPIQLVEEWTGHTLAFDQLPDGSIDPVGYTGEGRPCAVYGRCGCGHCWKIRGATQIINLPGHPDYQEQP